MILDKKDDLAAFRLAVRKWLANVVPPDWPRRMKIASLDELVEFQRWWMIELNKVGLGTPHWPAEVGGAGLNLAHQVILAEESAWANAPQNTVFIVAVNQVPGTLLRWGNDSQKHRYLPTVSQGCIWCQGFSEPNAGSDLASLRTKAVRDGDYYVINGQKIWSTYAMYADYCILLARTDSSARKHQGMSYFILDMHAAGVEVRPIRQSTGYSEFAEIFLTDVHIPVEDRVGEENAGWLVAQSTLTAERGILAFEIVERHRYELESFHRKSCDDNAAWLKDDQLRREFMHLFAEMQAIRRLVRKLLKESDMSHGVFSTKPAIVKLTCSTLKQRFAEFVMKISDLTGQLDQWDSQSIYNDVMLDYMNSFGYLIAGGTNEILRNVIAERGLGMPR